MKNELAVIDIGSNSIRYVIFHATASRRLEEKINVKVVARLSAHIDKKGALSIEGIELLIDTLNRFHALGESHAVEETLVVATAAIRNASNQEEISAAVETGTPYAMRILSDEQEAYYGYFAIINSTFLRDGFSVDIGGGSMEVTWIEDREMVAYHSFPFGAVTLTKRFVSGETMTETERKQLTKFLRSEFAKLPWLKGKKLPLIGVGGSARNFVKVHQAKTDYPLPDVHQYQVKEKELEKVIDDLFGLSQKQLAKVDGLSKDRIDIITPALLAIHELALYIGAEQFVMSNYGLREGLLYEHALEEKGETRVQNVKEESILQLETDYHVIRERNGYVGRLAHSVYAGLVDTGIIPFREADERLLSSASRLLYCGRYINPDTRSDQTFHLLTNTGLKGLTHKDRIALAVVSSFSSTRRTERFLSPYKDWFTAKSVLRFNLLGAILKFADGLDVTERSAIEHVDVSHDGKELRIALHADGHDCRFEIERGEKQKKHLERILDTRIRLEKGDDT
ncbi:Ppx/GppA family phosphatase [Exiguobacterium flavidum]|uniref:Ppx/GppA family phosphatase n=1 Tax=Exiguobacterium flavidum TaxID=2184695 RepID=UPI000DF738F1|nr:Ppx/GppA family phosphatase [Exiguobacterium flavidum]